MLAWERDGQLLRLVASCTTCDASTATPWLGAESACLDYLALRWLIPKDVPDPATAIVHCHPCLISGRAEQWRSRAANDQWRTRQ